VAASARRAGTVWSWGTWLRPPRREGWEPIPCPGPTRGKGIDGDDVKKMRNVTSHESEEGLEDKEVVKHSQSRFYGKGSADRGNEATHDKGGLTALAPGAFPAGRGEGSREQKCMRKK